eukprot:GHVT01068107.1.p1 GENE.GHVT01068107.1~~GHVT01068107.1.p1  ORF type:complete len:160 (+),score=36.90 GHVT01068107.1:65-544(+)
MLEDPPYLSSSSSSFSSSIRREEKTTNQPAVSEGGLGISSCQEAARPAATALSRAKEERRKIGDNLVVAENPTPHLSAASHTDSSYHASYSLADYSSSFAASPAASACSLSPLFLWALLLRREQGQSQPRRRLRYAPTPNARERLAHLQPLEPPQHQYQ